MATTHIITFNQLMRLFKQFQTSHPQLNDFDYGQTYDIGTSRVMQFPYMWATSEIDSTIQVTNKIVQPFENLTILLCDKINEQRNILNSNGENSNNGQEVISDMKLIALDLVTEIVNNWGQYGVSIEGDVPTFVVSDETDDKVNGVGIRLTLKEKYLNCEIPL